MKLQLAVGVLVGLLLAGTAAARDHEDVTGSVVSSGNASLVISTDEGTLYTFIVDTATVLPATAVEAGDRVTVIYRPLDDTHLQATEVVLVKTDEPATSSGAASTPDGGGSPPALDDTPPSASPALLAAFAGLGILGGGLVLRSLLTKAPVSPLDSRDTRPSEEDRAGSAVRPFGDRPL
jgi:hypothetical protein